MRVFSSLIPAMVSALFAALLAGCAQTSRVDEGVTTASLAQDKKAVAILRIGSASPTCRHVAILLGTPDGAGYRRHSILSVANVSSLVEPAVAETELSPGTYHVVGYSCHDGKQPHAVAQKADPGTYAKSYAHFTVQSGEIVNLGFLHFHAARIGTNAFGRPVRTTVSVSDWPLAELDRFKQKRPTIYAQMVTRLMIAAPTGPADPSAADCARLEELRAAGKVQQVPASCAATSPAPAKSRAPS
jgi:hypothetical protein